MLQGDTIIPDWLYQEFNEIPNNITIRIYYPKASKQIAKEKIKKDDKNLNKQPAKKLTTPITLPTDYWKQSLLIIQIVTIFIT